MAAKKRKNILMSISEDDTDILEWLDKQRNTNLSLRKSIRMCIEFYGNTDISELPTSRRRGRPKKTKVQYQQNNTSRDMEQKAQQMNNKFQESVSIQHHPIQNIKKEDENGMYLNTDFSGPFAHNEITNDDQLSKAQSGSTYVNEQSENRKNMNLEMMKMFNGGKI